jgi:hypothetical protein
VSDESADINKPHPLSVESPSIISLKTICSLHPSYNTKPICLDPHTTIIPPSQKSTTKSRCVFSLLPPSITRLDTSRKSTLLQDRSHDTPTILTIIMATMGEPPIPLSLESQLLLLASAKAAIVDQYLL